MEEQEYEVSPGGSRIIHYQKRSIPYRPAHETKHLDAITDHIEAHLGEVDSVFHELVSDLVHVDVHLVEPTAERPFYTLITSGMSEAPMKTPGEDGTPDLRWAELCLGLPGDWPVSVEAFKDENNYWPVRLLKGLARFPHEFDTWLGFGHSIPHGDPPRPYAENTQFVGTLLLPPITAPQDFWSLELAPGKEIQFWGLYMLYPEEMEYKLQHGTDALIDRFERARVRVTEVVDVTRPNTCAE